MSRGPARRPHARAVKSEPRPWPPKLAAAVWLDRLALVSAQPARPGECAYRKAPLPGAAAAGNAAPGPNPLLTQRPVAEGAPADDSGRCECPAL